ncbi:MAG: Ig-like domain-containing protein, partial [Gemmatimonadaceae bacterium]
WSTSAPSIATVDAATGLVKAVGPGSAIITATSEGKTGAASIVVTFGPVATVTVTPPSASLILGGPTTTLNAVLKDAYGNVLTGRAIVWTSSVPGVATVDASGVVTAVAAGTTSITATSETKFNTPATAITVTTAPVATVTVTPPSASLIVGGPTTTLNAVLKDAYGNVLTGRAIVWTSSVPGVATVDAGGVVTAVAAGATSITATSETKFNSPATAITVSLEPVATVAITPADSSVSISGTAIPNTVRLTVTAKNGGGTTLSLSGRTVIWSSSDDTMATVDATGLVTAVSTRGTATITATVDGVPGSTTVTVFN